jgi:PAS domain S-box-containing protein
MKLKRILIVNPDTRACDTLEETFYRAGYLAYTAANGLEAEKLALILLPDMIILADRLPDGAGLDILADLIRHTPDGLFFILTDKSRGESVVPDRFKEHLYYIHRDLPPERMLKSVSHIAEVVELRREKRSTESSLRKRNRELEEINERLRQIVESTRRLTSFSGTGDIGPVILHEFAGNMNAGGGSLFLHQADTLVLSCALDPGHVPERLPLPLPDHSVLNRVLCNNEAVLIEDIHKEYPMGVSGWTGYSDPSLLAFPLLEKQGNIIGVITLHNKKNPPFTTQDRELGAILASYGSETLRATQAIERLRQSEEKARIILEASPDPVVVFDNEKRVQYFNPAFTQVFGWSLDERIGQTMTEFMPENTLAESMMMESMEKKGQTYRGIETRRYAKSGTIIPVSVSGATFSDSSGKVLGSVRNIRDITAQKALEGQLVQSQKMEAIGTLSSGIAHDFNNILSAIFGNLDLALMDLPGDFPARRNIENIGKAAHRAKDLVSQILSFSRKDAGHSDDQQKIHPHLVIKEALFLLRASLPSTIEIKEAYVDKSGTILANPTQFHQIIMNLCTNAHHAMMVHGGTLTIRLEKTPDPDHPGGPSFVKLTISDTGCGMDEHTVKRIFDPYFTTKDKNLGTGLGLSVVRRIVDDCKGKISVFTHLGHGTRFEMLFPEAGEQTRHADGPGHVIGRGSGKVLFVDDEKEIAALGLSLLQRLGYTVVAQTQPMEALELVRTAPQAFDVVITDMTMPKMTGIRLAEALKTIRPDLPIILCTGFNPSEIVDSIPDGTIDAILKKPVGLADFFTVISGLIDKAGPRNDPPVSELHLHPL